MQRWAYATVRQKAGRWQVEGDTIRGDRFQSEVFTAMGMNGWEMVAVDDSGAFHFKRPTRATHLEVSEEEPPARTTTRRTSNDSGNSRRSSDVA